MYYCNYVLRDSMVRIDNLKKNFIKKPQDNLNVMISVLYDMKIALNELLAYHEDKSMMMVYKVTLDNLIDSTKKLDSESFEKNLNTMKELFENYDFDTNYARVQYEAGIFMKHYRFNRNTTINTVANFLSIDEINRDLNVFVPYCYSGEYIKSVMESTRIESASRMKTYGITDDQLMYAKERLYKAVKGRNESARISNDVFDISIITPPITYVDNSKVTYISNNKIEKVVIQNNFKYLRENGCMIIIMPYFRLYRDMCTMLSKNLKDIKVFKTCDSKNNIEDSYVVIVGYKNKSIDVKEDEYQLLRRVAIDKTKAVILSDEDRVKIKNKNLLEVKDFRGSSIDLDELDTLSFNSNLVFNSFKTSSAKDKMLKRPILPFNIGQIGLVLTSGCLDGIVDEGDGNYHLIKGNVKKIVSSETNISGDNSTVEKTTSNKVEINILTPDGTYKTLA